MKDSQIRVVPSSLAVRVVLAVLIAAAPGTALASKRIVKDMSEVFIPTAPLTPPPGAPAEAAAETTIRHTVFYDDMESYVPGFSAGEWQVLDFRQGQPSAWNVVPGTHSCTGNAWWCGQAGLLNGDGYDNNWVQVLKNNSATTPIDLENTSNNKLTFKYRVRTEYSYDWGWVLLRSSAPGARWDTLASFSGDFGSNCGNASIDIPNSYTTVTQPVQLMFLFGSDLTVSTADSLGMGSPLTGWSLDDVKITGQGNDVRFFDDMEAGSGKWIAGAASPGNPWHLESGPGTSVPASCFFLSTNVWVPFSGFGFGFVPDFVDAMLITPPMDLHGVFTPATPTTSLRLQFDDWINLPFDNGVYWSLWISGSNDRVTWTPWRNALGSLVFSGGTPQCIQGSTTNFNPYNTNNTGIQPGTRWIRLGFRLRDEKPTIADGGPLYLGVQTEGIYYDNVGVYYIYTIAGVENVSLVPAGTSAAITKAYPNPFNPRTTIEFSVPKSGRTEVRVFDLHGRLVRSLVDGTVEAGVHRVRWDGKDEAGRDLTTGVYFAQVESAGSRDGMRLTLLK